MNPIRPFKFEKLASCSCCCASAPVVALGDDQGLTIAQLVEKYGASLFGDHHAAVEQLPALIGKVNNFEAAEAINVDDHYELDRHHVNHCTLLQGVSGKVVITDNTGKETTIAEGDTLLIPAASTLIEIDGHGDVLIAKLK